MTDRMRWLGQCETKGCFLEARFKLTDLDGTLPHGAQFGDLDGWAEIDGRFLFIEHKPAGYRWDQSNGQWLALKRLAQLPGVTVWWIRDCDDGYEMAEPGKPLVKISQDQLRDAVKAWAANALLQRSFEYPV